VTLFFAVAVFLPGLQIPNFAADSNAPGPLDLLSDDDLDVLITEARDQLARQRDDLKSARSTAQWLTTLDLLALPLGLSVIVNSEVALDGIWLAAYLLSILSFVIGLLAAVGVIVGYAPLGIVHAARLTEAALPLSKSLAEGLTNSVAMGENTVATRRTVVRSSALLTLVGAALGLTSAAVAFAAGS